MGCASSTEVVTDPITGESKTKKKLGGAYPGQRRPNQGQYAPADVEFGKDGKATVHFKAVGGGNALQLVQQNGVPTQPTATANGGGPEFIQVTLPPGVEAGQTIHVAAPDGKVNAIVVPPGMGPGSTFTVEFEREPEIALGSAPMAHAMAIPESTNHYENLPVGAATPAAPHRPDDGFASGFGQNTRY